MYSIYTYLHVYACGPKTVPVKRTFLNIAIVGWSGVGWGGMLTFLVLRTWYIAMLLRSLGLFTTLHVATLLRSLGSFTTLHVATLLRSLGSFTTLQCATLLRSLGSFTTLHAATLLRSLGSFTTLHVLCGIWWKSQFPAAWVPKVTSWWCMLAAWQWRCIHQNADCQLITVHALQRWRWKVKKNAPQVFPRFPIIKSARHCGKIAIFLKNVRFMGTASGPAGCVYIYILYI